MDRYKVMVEWIESTQDAITSLQVWLAMGRPRRFCSAKCRVAHNRAFKRWARESVDAALAGKPEPGPPGKAVELARYETDQAGNLRLVTKLRRSGR